MAIAALCIQSGIEVIAFCSNSLRLVDHKMRIRCFKIRDPDRTCCITVAYRHLKRKSFPATTSGPVNWPPRPPELSATEVFLCRCLKGKVKEILSASVT